MNLDENVRTMLRERAGSVAAAPVVPDRTVRRVRMKKALSAGTALAVVAALGVAGAFLARSALSTDAAPISPATTPDAAETTGAPERAQDIMAVGDFSPLETGTYYIDPDDDPTTPLRVEYEIAADGWAQWLGAAKFLDHPDGGHVGVSITTMTNVARHGCRDQRPLDPPVGPTVDDLADALAGVPPFRVTSPPADVTMHGYRGKHVELTVPDLPVERTPEGLEFPTCEDRNLTSWFSPWDPVEGFFGHSGPGYTEEFWILDVEGTRLVIVAHTSPSAAPKDIAEARAIIDSIQIEP